MKDMIPDFPEWLVWLMMALMAIGLAASIISLMFAIVWLLVHVHFR